MSKLEAFKKLSAAFFKAATNKAVINAAADVQDAEDIVEALESFAEALDLQNPLADTGETQ